MQITEKEPPRKKSFISKTSKVKENEFAKSYDNKSLELKKKNDENKFYFFSSDGKKIVQRKPNTSLLI